ncbi:hypothetical protein [Rhodopila sp.]|uniref:hypothetical protein n=1 Tax=Rhodopila sp. TaxID=2480087 RepID=UPI003D118DE4
MTDRRAALEAALKRLPVLPDGEAKLQRALDRLETLADADQPISDIAFRLTGKAAAKRELKTLVRDARTLDAEALGLRIRSMHAPAIKALADVGFTRMPGGRAAAAAAAVADVGSVPTNAGRGRSQARNRANVVAAQLVIDFATLTGIRPTQKPVQGLTDRVFAILGIELRDKANSTESIVREAIKAWSAREKL